jgi:hypothetical protein
MCHGAANPPKGIDVLKYASLQATGVLKNDGSEHGVMGQVQTGAMPLGGPPVPPEEIKALAAWIAAGAPDWGARTPATGRKPIVEAEVLKAILKDLQNADERKRAYLRYYSLVNLYNSLDVSDEDLALYRTALAKLVNSLSWERDITKPTPIDANGVILRIDLRDFKWNPEIWQRVVAAYPYGVKPRSLAAEIRRIQDLSGATLPYIRVDWFVANASLPPLYEQILQLPPTISGIEQALGVDSERDVEEEKVARAGVRDSGVSRNNRVVERHHALYGSYWKSFDFADNVGEHNIFKNPVSLHPAGGECIFSLPNGLQGYFLAKGTGEALADGPPNIVRDVETNHGDDPVVHNGRSCMGCHYAGMRHIRDEVRALLTDDKKAIFDVGKARALYPPQAELERWLTGDSKQFNDAVTGTGAPVASSPANEPINRISALYSAQLSAAQAAADAGLSVQELQRQIARNSDLRRLGFDQLEGANGGIKRDAWEEYFGQLAETLGLGDYIAPATVSADLPLLAGRARPAAVNPIVALQRATATGSIHITLSADKGGGATYRVGETVGISFGVDRACSLALYDIDPAGVVTLLFPNRYMPDGHLVPGQTYRLQDASGNGIIEVLSGGTFGVETLLAVATPGRTQLPGIGAFEADPISKSLGVVDRNTVTFASSLKRVASGNAGVSTAVVRLVTAQ